MIIPLTHKLALKCRNRPAVSIVVASCRCMVIVGLPKNIRIDVVTLVATQMLRIWSLHVPPRLYNYNQSCKILRMNFASYHSQQIKSWNRRAFFSAKSITMFSSWARRVWVSIRMVHPNNVGIGVLIDPSASSKK